MQHRVERDLAEAHFSATGVQLLWVPAQNGYMLGWGSGEPSTTDWVDGALYLDTSVAEVKSYNGSAWETMDLAQYKADLLSTVSGKGSDLIGLSVDADPNDFSSATTLTGAFLSLAGGTGERGVTTQIHVDFTDGDDTNGNGTFIAPYKTLTKAMIVVTGTRKYIYLNPGTYIEASTVTWPDISGVEVYGKGAQGSVTITPPAGQHGITVDPTAIVAWNMTLTNVHMTSLTSYRALNIDNANHSASGDMTINLRDVSIASPATSDYAIYMEHSTAARPTHLSIRNSGESITGIVHQVYGSASDTTVLDDVVITAELATSANAVAAHMTLRDCEMRHGRALTGGNAAQLVYAAGCTTNNAGVRAPLDSNDCTGSHTVTYLENAFVGTVSVNGTLAMSDDSAITFGGVASLLYETVDADANALILSLPAGGGTDVPVFAIGTANATAIIAQDMGWFNGVTETSLVLVDTDGDSYTRFSFSADDTPAITVGGAATLLAMPGMTVGTAATGIDFTGTYTGNVIDFSNATIDPTGSGGPCFIRAGTYASPIDYGADNHQSGIIRIYSTCSGDGSSYDRGLFACCKTTGAKGAFPVAGLAEANNTGTGPAKLQAAQFIAHLGADGSASKLATLGGDPTAGMYGAWLKITAGGTCEAQAGSRCAPCWIDNQMSGSLNGEEWGIFATTGASRPDAFIGFETTSSGYDQLFHFDSTFNSGAGTCVTTDAVPGTQDARIKVYYNGAQYYLALYR